MNSEISTQSYRILEGTGENDEAHVGSLRGRGDGARRNGWSVSFDRGKVYHPTTLEGEEGGRKISHEIPIQPHRWSSLNRP